MTSSKTLARQKANRARSLSSAEKKRIKKTKTITHYDSHKKKKGFSISFNRTTKSEKTQSENTKSTKKTKKISSSADHHRRTHLEEITVSTPQFLGKNITAELGNLPRTDLARIKLDQPLSPTAFSAYNKPPISPNTTTVVTIISPPSPPAVPQMENINNNQNNLPPVITVLSPAPPATSHTNGEAIQNDHTLSNRFTIPSGNN